MRVRISFILGFIIIGPCLAYITPPYDGCVWGISSSDLLIESGQVISDAVLTIQNIRPDVSCLNPSLSIYLLNSPLNKLIQTSDPSKSLHPLFENGQSPTLSAHWKLNETSGSVASDASGKGNHAILINNPLWTDGQGLSFNGTQYLQIPPGEGLNPSAPMAVSLWCKLRSPVRYAKLLIKPFQTRSDPWELYALDLGWDGLTPRFLLSNGIPNGQYEAASGGDNKIIPNQWTHLVGTYDGRQMRLYLNGRLVSQTDTTLQIGANSMPLCIGGRLGLDTFDGIIRDVRIYAGPVSSHPLHLADSSQLFEHSGTPLRKINLTDLRDGGQNLSFSLQEVNIPDSWTHSIYGTSFSMPIPGRTAPLSFSSAMLELLDYVGRANGFGIGLNTDGFLFDKITLTVTTESCRLAQTPLLQTLTYQNKYAPVILPIPQKTTEPGLPLSFPVLVSELDQNPWTLSALNLPPGAVFRNKTFSWTPAANQVGLWTLTFQATDGVMTGQRKVQIQVNPSTPIFAAVANPVLYELQTLTLPITALNLAGQPVPVTVSDLPANALFDGTTLQWRPAYGQAGTYSITLSASNEIRQEQITVTITVLPYRPLGATKTILIL
jgi:hypothetical protein